MKTYMAEYMKKRRLKRREELLLLFGNCCKNCGSQEDLQFDHVDRERKEFELSGCNLDRSWAKILEEVKKCELLCVKCHRLKTKSFGDDVSWRKAPKEYLHGTSRTYGDLKCRCSLCKKAKSLHRRREIGINEVVKML